MGIDLGGTKIEAIALEQDGRTLARERVATPRSFSGTVEAIGAPGGTAAFWLIDHLLAVHDRHLLHGACLIAPAADGATAAPRGSASAVVCASRRRGFVWSGA